MKLVGLETGKIDNKVLGPVLDKLRQLVLSRYSCGFKYIPLEDLAENQKRLLCSLGPNSKPVSCNGKLLFSIVVKNDIVGAAELNPSGSLSEDYISAIRRVIQLVLESTIVASENLEVIETLENQMKLKKPSNVVPFSDLRKKSRIDSPIANFDVSFDGETRYNQPILIEGTNTFDNHKMAIEIHEKSKRFAFLNFNQLDRSVRTSIGEFKNLGPVTIYVEDISKLADQEIFTLIDYLKNHHTDDGPQIIGSSLKEIKALVDQEIIPGEFITLLNGAFLRLNKPFNEYIQQGLDEFFFDNLI